MTALPIHPEATDEPDVLRWVFPLGTLDFVGGAVAVPAPLQQLYDVGVLVGGAVVEPGSVLLRLAPDRSWRTEGAVVRRALAEALAAADAWEPPRGASDDDVLRAAAAEVLRGEVGDFVRGHGGVIEVLDAADDEVTISLGGACAGCPASGTTVQHRFEEALRRRYPALRGVVAHEVGPDRRSRLLTLLPTRH